MMKLFNHVALALLLCGLLSASAGCAWVGKTAGKTQAKVEKKVEALEEGYQEGYSKERSQSKQ
jgi:hypothetical protein